MTAVGDEGSGRRYTQLLEGDNCVTVPDGANMWIHSHHTCMLAVWVQPDGPEWEAGGRQKGTLDELINIIKKRI